MEICKAPTLWLKSLNKRQSMCCGGPTVGDCPYLIDMQGTRPEAMIVATIRARPFGVAV